MYVKLYIAYIFFKKSAVAYDLKIEFYAEDMAQARKIAEGSLREGEHIGEIKQNGTGTYFVPNKEEKK